MSRIYFHNIKKTAEVYGMERASVGIYCSEALLLALGSLESWGNDKPWIMKHIPESCYLHGMDDRMNNLTSSIKTWLNVGNEHLVLDGEKHSVFELQLNSAVAIGGDVMKLAAKIHGQCEIHCYVEGKNRGWLAGIIEDGLKKHIFRSEMGWEDVIELLRMEDDSPVVCSYSVCEQFPNSHTAEWDSGDDEDDDAWYELPEEKQWELAMIGLRKNGGGLELSPDDWNYFFFGPKPVSGFDFRNAKR